MSSSSLTRLILAIMVCLAPIQGFAGFDEALAAYNRKDYAAALNEWGPLAVHGDARAQVGLGLIYINGNGVSRDERQAAVWFRRAAEQGNAKAQVQLAKMYIKGQGVNKDLREAYKWLSMASAKGHPDPGLTAIVEKMMSPDELAEAKKQLQDTSDAKKACVTPP